MSGRENQALGHWGEEQAAKFLKKKGCRVLARNWRCRLGEIDLIVEDGSCLCFVEVKLRKSDAYGRAAEFVDWRKQQRLRATAQLYLEEHPTQQQPRFDVVEVYAPQGTDTRAPEISRLENAF